MHRYAQNVEVNYLGAVRMTRAFLPMLRASRGRVCNIGSIGARMPSAFGSSYLPAKAAMLSYSECTRQELFRHGVKVAYIEPGFFATGLRDSASANGASHAATLLASSLGTGDKGEQRTLAYPSFDLHMEKVAGQIQCCERLNGGIHGVTAVIDAAIDAIGSRIPLCRYTVGYDAILIRYVLCWVPDRLLDAVATYL